MQVLAAGIEMLFLDPVTRQRRLERIVAVGDGCEKELTLVVGDGTEIFVQKNGAASDGSGVGFGKNAA